MRQLCMSRGSIGVTVGNVVEEHDGGRMGQGCAGWPISPYLFVVQLAAPCTGI